MSTSAHYSKVNPILPPLEWSPPSTLYFRLQMFQWFEFTFLLGVINHHLVKAELCVILCVTDCTCRLQLIFRFVGHR